MPLGLEVSALHLYPFHIEVPHVVFYLNSVHLKIHSNVQFHIKCIEFHVNFAHESVNRWLLTLGAKL